MSDDPDTTAYTVMVHTPVQGASDVSHPVKPGHVPMLETNDRELWISQTDDGGKTETVIAVYGRDQWASVWLVETERIQDS